MWSYYTTEIWSEKIYLTTMLLATEHKRALIKFFKEKDNSFKTTIIIVGAHA